MITNKRKDGYVYTDEKFEEWVDHAVDFVAGTMGTFGVGGDALYAEDTVFVLEKPCEFPAAAREAAKICGDGHFYGTAMLKPFIKQESEADVIVLFRATDDHVCHLVVAVDPAVDDEVTEALERVCVEEKADKDTVLESLADALRDEIWQLLHPVLH